MAELAAPIIHEDAALIDADIEIQWCRGRLADPDSGRADARNRLAELLDRVAKAEARTLRGAAIKLQHSNGSAQDQAQKAELRALAEALAADNSAPLPDGDAGLMRRNGGTGNRGAVAMRFTTDSTSTLKSRTRSWAGLSIRARKRLQTYRGNRAIRGGRSGGEAAAAHRR